MIYTQTVTIPANRRLTIDIPPEVPVGPVTITYTPLGETSDFIAAESGDSYLDCPECAKHCDPKTGELRFNAVTLAAMQEARDIASGKIPGEWHHSIEEARKDLGV